LNNYLATSRQKRLGKTKACLQDLINYAKANEIIPDDEHKDFVAGYQYELDDEVEFRIFLTTKKLLSFTQYVI
jgi:hypothetical protein